MKKKVAYSKLRFSKSLSPSSFLEAPTQADIIEFSNFLLQLKNLILIFKRISTF